MPTNPELDNIINSTVGSCIICFDDLTNETTVASCNESGTWGSNRYCVSCLEYYKTIMWVNYITNVINADCEKALKRAVESPMPFYLTTDLSFKSDPIISYYHNNEIKSAKLDLKFDETTVENIRLDIIKLKNNIEQDSNYDYLSEIHFITERYNLHEYKKKVINLM